MRLFLLLSASFLLLALSSNFFPSSSIAETSASEAVPISKVVPNVNENTAASGTFLGPLANAPRTYQLLINESELTNVAGSEIKAISFRIPPSATADWPPADATSTSYDIYLSPSVAPASRSLTFANNVAGTQVLVRSGSLTVTAGSYTFGGNPNAFGPDITFNTPYAYNGGHLLIEIRMTGFSGTSRSIEATTTSTSGYGTLFSACWTGSYTGVSGSQGNFGTVRLKYEFANPTLQFTGLIEGMYDNITDLMVRDTATIVLRDGTSPYAVVDNSKDYLSTSGKGIFKYLAAVNGANYYAVATQRNSINTWSAVPLVFNNNFLAYNFTSASAQAFGNNMKQKGSKWTFYSGDIVRDGSIDLSDIVAAFNDATLFVSGYVVTDVNGDSFVDLSDITIVFNNAISFVTEIAP